jgi:V/A-type H+-transporting ATPase subunit D
MELLKLKKRLKTAIKGHKLLKEKRDGLMKEFMEIIKVAKETRKKMEEILSIGFHSYTLASANMTDMTINTASQITSQKMTIDFSTKSVMSVKIPQINFSTKGDYISYGFYDTSGELDIALKNMQESLPTLIKLAQIEKSAQMLALEIEKTRRRVNALEHVMIPNLQETVKYIQMKLSEQERSVITTTMVVKEMIENK